MKYRILTCLLCTAAVLLCEGLWAGTPESYVSPLWEEWKQSGEIRKQKEVTKDEYTVTLWTQEKAYDAASYLSKEKVDTEIFFKDILDVFDWVFINSHKCLEGPVKKYNLVLVDGFRNDSVSAALRGTNAICLEVRKWHERMYARQSRKQILYLSAAHEEFHVQNYQTDGKEEQFTHEFSAMLWEASVLIKRSGKVNYLWGGMNSNKKQVLSRELDPDVDFTKEYNSFLMRGVAYFAANIIYKGSEMEGLERISRLLLNDKKHGVKSINAIFEEEKVTSGEELVTCEMVLEGYRKYLKR